MNALKGTNSKIFDQMVIWRKVKNIGREDDVRSFSHVNCDIYKIAICTQRIYVKIR